MSIFTNPSVAKPTSPEDFRAVEKELVEYWRDLPLNQFPPLILRNGPSAFNAARQLGLTIDPRTLSISQLLKSVNTLTPEESKLDEFAYNNPTRKAQDLVDSLVDRVGFFYLFVYPGLRTTAARFPFTAPATRSAAPDTLVTDLVSRGVGVTHTAKDEFPILVDYATGVRNVNAQLLQHALVSHKAGIETQPIDYTMKIETLADQTAVSITVHYKDELVLKVLALNDSKSDMLRRVGPHSNCDDRDYDGPFRNRFGPIEYPNFGTWIVPLTEKGGPLHARTTPRRFGDPDE